MRLKRLLVGTFTAALVGAVPVLTAAPSGAAPAAAAATCTAPTGHTAVPTRMYLYPNKSTYKYGQAIPVRGQVHAQESDGSWAFLAPVGVKLARAYPNQSFTGIDTGNTSSTDGYFRFSTTAWANAGYRASFAGLSHTAPETGVKFWFCPATGGRTIKVSRHEHVRIPSGTLSFVGDVDPDWGRRYVTVQKKTCLSCSWKTYKRVLTNSNGGFRASLSAPRSGRWYFRTYVPGTSPRFVAAYSDVWYTYQTSGRRS